jgi:hypothetical protein
MGNALHPHRGSFDFAQDEGQLTMASAIFLILSEVEGRILLVQGA